MTKSKFQLVGSLLRPADLRKYKDEIEHRDDISILAMMPFWLSKTEAILSKLWLTKS